jgi:hypothetical protein
MAEKKPVNELGFSQIWSHVIDSIKYSSDYTTVEQFMHRGV